MTKSNKLRGLTAAMAVAALFASQPAAADVIEINSLWAGGQGVTIQFDDPSYITPLVESTVAGGFKTYNRTQNPGQAFLSFCVDIFDRFSFTAVSDSTSHPAADVIGTQAAADLGMLYANQHGLVDPAGYSPANALNQAAFQLAVWEIVNDEPGNYDLNAGAFIASGNAGAVTLANSWLAALGTTPYRNTNPTIWTVDTMRSDGTGRGYAQDIVTFTPVPEPETYAMMLVGLGLLGFSARRKNQNMV